MKLRLNKEVFSQDSSKEFRELMSREDKTWNWYYISLNPIITIKEVVFHPNFPWNWEGLSRNPSITMKDILSHMELPWQWWCLSRNLSIGFRDILDNMGMRWNGYEGIVGDVLYFCCVFCV